MRSGLMAAALGILLARGARAARVVNPRLITDSSVDTFSAETVVKQIIRPRMTDEEKAIACWRFMLEHFYHWYPPREPDTAGDVRDFAKIINSYGFGPCFVNAPVLTALWEAAGLQTRSWTVTGHSIPEVKYGGKWHMIDADARAFHRGADGHIVGVEELARDRKLHVNPPGGRSDPFYPFGKPDEKVAPLDPWGPPSKMLDLYLSRRNNYRYNRRAVRGHPMYLTLRQGEGVSLSYANEGSFYNAGYPEKKLKPGPIEVKGRYTYGNGRLVWRPDLRKIPASELFWMGSRNVKLERGRLVAEKTGRPAVAVFRVWCPYVLVEAGAEVSCTGRAAPKYELSIDGGRGWAEVGDITRLDAAAGRYEYLLRVTFNDGALTRIGFNNLFQHSQLALPRLKAGRNTVRLLRGPDEGVVQLVRAKGKQNQKRYLVASDPGAEGDPAYKIYRLRAPAPLTAVSIGANMSVETHSHQWICALYSLDDGENWRVAWRRMGNTNRQNSQFEEYKKIRLENPARSEEVLVKFMVLKLHRFCSVNSVRLYAFYSQPQPARAKLAVDYAWQERRGEKWVERKKSVVADRFPYEFKIDCGGRAARTWRIEMRPVD